MSKFDENSGELNIPNVAALLKLRKDSFGDPNPMGTARRELHHLRQGKGDFAKVFAPFTHLVCKLQFNEATKRDALE